MIITQEEAAKKMADGIEKNVRYENDILRRVRNSPYGMEISDEAWVKSMFTENRNMLQKLNFPADKEETLKSLLYLMGADKEADRKRRKELFQKAVDTVVKPIDVMSFLSDPFFHIFDFYGAKAGKYQLTGEPTKANNLWFDGIKAGTELYYPGTPEFVCYDKDVKIPCITRQDDEAVRKSYITPFQIRHAKSAAHCARGNVLVLGAGFGYFAYVAAQRKEVKSITVVDSDEDAVKLFKSWIRPHLPNREKIFAYYDEDILDFMEDSYREYDFCYVDEFPDRENGFLTALALEGILASGKIRHMNYYSDMILYYSAYETFLDTAKELDDCDKKKRVSYLETILGQRGKCELLKRLQTLNKGIPFDEVREKALDRDRFGSELFGSSYVCKEKLFA